MEFKKKKKLYYDSFQKLPYIILEFYTKNMEKYHSSTVLNWTPISITKVVCFYILFCLM